MSEWLYVIILSIITIFLTVSNIISWIIFTENLSGKIKTEKPKKRSQWITPIL